MSTAIKSIGNMPPPRSHEIGGGGSGEPRTAIVKVADDACTILSHPRMIAQTDELGA